MANRQIIVLDASQDATQTMLTIRFMCWLVAPASRIRPMPNFVSQAPTSSQQSWGVTAAELAALQAGTIVESGTTANIPVSLATVANIEAQLQATYSALQTQLTNQVFPGGVHFVGAVFDGTSWTAGP